MKVIQISDTHLFCDDDLAIFGIKSNLKFKEVMTKMTAEDHDVDMIFLTGDVSQDETVESYRKIVHYLSALNIPIYWISGNHDDLSTMKAVFKNVKNLHYGSNLSLSLSHWHFIFLNTQVAGRDDGQLLRSELNMLREELKKVQPDKKIGIVMHHHPAPVGTPLIDKYILKDAEEFWDIIAKNKAVELIICGHVHGDYSFIYNNIMIESSPATCLQWEKGTNDLKLDERIGYKVYYFDQKGFSAKAKMW